MRAPRWLYWFAFPGGGPTVEMVDLPSGPQRFRWSRIHGVQIGPWFIGAIKGVKVDAEA